VAFAWASSRHLPTLTVGGFAQVAQWAIGQSLAVGGAGDVDGGDAQLVARECFDIEIVILTTIHFCLSQVVRYLPLIFIFNPLNFINLVLGKHFALVILNRI
jgi:hypothetical protein